MSKIEKLFKKILRFPKEVRFEELKRVLISLGYVLRPGKGSHTVFCHPKYPVLVVPHCSPVKRVYIEQVKEVLQSYESGKKDKTTFQP